MQILMLHHDDAKKNDSCGAVVAQQTLTKFALISSLDCKPQVAEAEMRTLSLRYFCPTSDHG